MPVGHLQHYRWTGSAMAACVMALAFAARAGAQTATLPGAEWRPVAARDEIRPEFRLEQGGALIIRSDAREGLAGHWEKTVPVTGGRPALGTWQGIYLFEHRRAAQTRHVVAHLLGE